MDCKQVVKVGKEILPPMKLKSEVPQVTFFPKSYSQSTVWIWKNWSDTSNSGQEVGKVIDDLEEDTTNILQFMTSNGLVANSSKTEFMLLNDKTTDANLKIKVGTD